MYNLKKKLGICGDSFMAAINKSETNPNNGYGKHFTEILREKLKCDVVTFAKGGVSNQTIRLQIEEIIKEKPDHVIIGTTTPDRIEIPISDVSISDYDDKWKEKNYHPFNSLYNIKYDDTLNNQSSNHTGFKQHEPTMISETINNLFNYHKNNKIVTKEKKQAIKDYYNYIYDYEWKMQQDSWILCDGLYKLEKRGITFNIILHNLHLHYFDDFKESIIGPDSELNPWKYYNNKIISPYPFHLLEEDEINLAKFWYNKLYKQFLNNKLI